MNKTESEVKDYLMTFLPRYEGKVDLTLCLPFTALHVGRYLCQGHDIRLGAQNISDEEEGRCTGEISGRMLKDSGVDFVIVGWQIVYFVQFGIFELVHVEMYSPFVIF